MDNLDVRLSLYYSAGPPSGADIEFMVNSLGPLPQDYVDMIVETGACELVLVDGPPLIFWAPREVVEVSMPLKLYVPEIVIVGDDGGPDSFALLEGESVLYRMCREAPDRESMEFVAPSITEFLVSGIGIDLVQWESDIEGEG